MWRARVAAAFALLSAAIACGETTFDTSAGADTSDSDAGSDATIGSDADVADASGDESENIPGNLLTDPGFETDASSGCGSYWVQGTNTTLSISSVAHSGKTSCLVCVSGSAGAVANNVIVEPLASLEAGIYEGAMWVMPVAAEGSPPATVAVAAIHQQLTDGGADEQNGSGFAVTAGTWTKPYVDEHLDPEVSVKIVAYIFPDPDAGTGCALVDDVSFVKQ